jgi:P-type Ca2+ transporter type 2C
MTTVQGPTVAAPAESTWYTLPGFEVARTLRVDVSRGLTAEDAGNRLFDVGPNQLVTPPAAPRPPSILLRYRDPGQLALVCAGLGSLALGHVSAAVAILAASLVAAVLRRRLEEPHRARPPVLRVATGEQARVRRDGGVRLLPARALVPGDVVLVRAGDVVPADGRLIDGAALQVDERRLTGGTIPAFKAVEAIEEPQTPLADRADMVYMGTLVTQGTGEFVVTATGMATEIAAIAWLLAGTPAPARGPIRRMTDLTARLTLLGAAGLALTAALGLARGQHASVTWSAVVAFAVAAVPAGLPLASAGILACGARALGRLGVAVRRPDAAATLGCVSVVVVDESGCLTTGERTAVELRVPGHRYTVTGGGYAAPGSIRHVGGDADVDLEPFLLAPALATEAAIRDGELSGDPLEGALVALAEKGGIDVAATREALPRIARLPFDTRAGLAASFRRADGADVVRCFVWGAPDQLLARGVLALTDAGATVRLDPEFRGRYRKEARRLASRGLHVVATAQCELDATVLDSGGDLLPMVDRLTHLMLVGIAVQPRPRARESVKAALAAGMSMYVISGDRPDTTSATLGRLGVEGRLITPDRLAAMSADAASAAVDGIGVIARATAAERVRLVRALQNAGQPVAAVGCDVTDAPALQVAEVGVALGPKPEAVADHVAALAAVDGELATVVRAIERGRSVLDGLVDYARFQLGALAGIIASFLGAGVLGIAAGAPLLALQALYVNVTTQVVQGIGLGSAALRRPTTGHHPRSARGLRVSRGDAGWIAFAALVHAVVTLTVVALAEHWHGAAVARTMGFVTFSGMNILYSFAVCSAPRSLLTLDARAYRPLGLATAASVCAVVAGAESSPLQRLVGTTGLGPGQWLICLAAALLFATAFETYARVVTRARSARQPR